MLKPACFGVLLTTVVLGRGLLVAGIAIFSLIAATIWASPTTIQIGWLNAKAESTRTNPGDASGLLALLKAPMPVMIANTAIGHWLPRYRPSRLTTKKLIKLKFLFTRS